MRTFTMTAMALALAVTATAADAKPKHHPKSGMWINNIQGMGGDLNLKHVMPHTVAVTYPYKIVKVPHLDTPNLVELEQVNKGDMSATLKLNSYSASDVTGTAAAVGNTANIETVDGVHVEGNQFNFGDGTADLNGGKRYYRWYGYTVPASVIGSTNVELTAAAIGNSANIEAGVESKSWYKPGADVQARLFQLNTGDMAASLSADVHGYHMDSVDLTAAAVGNSINIQGTDDAVVGAHQINAPGSKYYGRYIELDSDMRAYISGYGGEVATTAASVGNSFSLEFGDSYDFAIAAIEQENFGDARAVNKTVLRGKFKKLDATAAAIGNSINISNVLDSDS
ncbi:MAG: hypothetical protein AAF543_20575 [Pseudomonadota bacterium]